MLAPMARNKISSCFQEGSGSEAPMITVGTLRSISQLTAGKNSPKYRCSCGCAMKQTEGGSTSPPAGAARPPSSASLPSASSRVPWIVRRHTICPFSSVMMGFLGSWSALASGTRLLSGSSSPRKPTRVISRAFIPGSRSSNGAGMRCRSSHVDDAPRNHNERQPFTAAGSRHQLPSTANCSIDQRTLLVSERPQSLPSAGGASPCEKASEGTSSSVHLTAHLLRASSRACSCFSSSSLSPSSSFAHIFLMFFFCFSFCRFHSCLTSCCICLAAALVDSTSSRSFSVARHSSNLCMAFCALALRYKAFVTCCGGSASLRQSALSTDRSAPS
mmetsp:Transcript_22587/g.59668  ORF Transcript_22587/g.59668 Transcript_22587/m.59668 type:complete len:331 (+) Transcript_22587:205-1197(+)